VRLVDGCGGNDVPVISSQEVHCRDRVDFGSEAGGIDGVHLLEDGVGTDPVEALQRTNGGYFNRKRRHRSNLAIDRLTRRRSRVASGVSECSKRKGVVQGIVPLTLGWKDLARAISQHGADPSICLRDRVPAVLLALGGWLLLDTCFNPACIRDPPPYRRYHRRITTSGPSPRPGGDPVEVAVGDDRLGVGDVVVVAASHLQNDRDGGVVHLAGPVSVHAQRRELAYGLSDHPHLEQHRILRMGFDDPIIGWRLADGEVEFARGVAALPTYGHIPCPEGLAAGFGESVSGGGFVFDFDAAYLVEYIGNELSVQGFLGADPEACVTQIRELKFIAAARNVQLRPGHNRVVSPAIPDEPRRARRMPSHIDITSEAVHL
jgi:hypothetical protein